MNKPLDYTALPLAEAWQRLVEDQPKLRIRDAAELLQTSEAKLLASQLDAGNFQQQQVRRLQGPFGPLMKQLESLGEVMVLTRNDAMVHEKVGQFKGLTLHGSGERQMGLALGEIDLRLFMGQFVFGFEVASQTPRGVRHSLQFFDASGNAVHKVYARENTNMNAWQALVDEYLAVEQSSDIETLDTATTTTEQQSLLTPPASLDIAALDADWRELKDVHHFMALLKKHQLQRVPAYQAIGSEFAVPLTTDAFELALEHARQQQLPIMVFVGNKGCIQIHTGPVSNLKRLGPWFNVLDDGFNLHARTDLIGSAWLVRKPTSDGIISSLEVFDQHGQQLAMLFGQRENNQPEREQWRLLLQQLAERCSLVSAQEHNANEQQEEQSA